VLKESHRLSSYYIDCVKVEASHRFRCEASYEHNTTKITIKKDSVEAVTEQDFKINGAKVTSDGDFVTSDGISLRNVKQVYNNHTHGGGEVPSPQL